MIEIITGRSGDSAAYDVSGDGNVLVGYAGGSGFRWTQAQGVQFLPPVSGHNRATAAAISEDGSTIVGAVVQHDDRRLPGRLLGLRW